jgi:hypothetical protein
MSYSFSFSGTADEVSATFKLEAAKCASYGMRHALLIAVLVLVGCAHINGPTTDPVLVPTDTSVAPVVTPPAAPDVPELKAFDPLARFLTSPKFVADAQASLAIAGTSDQMFSQCVQFQLVLGRELAAKPLVVVPNLALPLADPACPLCVIAAVRKDDEFLQSGALLGQIADVRARLRDIRKRIALACGPLWVDQAAAFNRLAAMAGLAIK